MNPPGPESAPHELVTHLGYRGRVTLVQFDAATAGAVWRLPEELRAASSCRGSELGLDLWESLPVTPGVAIASLERCREHDSTQAAWRMMVMPGPAVGEKAAAASETGPRAGDFFRLQWMSFHPDCPQPLLILIAEPELRGESGHVMLNRDDASAIPVGDLAEWARWSGAGILVTHRKSTPLPAGFLRSFHRVMDLAGEPGTLRVTASVTDGAGDLVERLPLWLDRPGRSLVTPPRDNPDYMEWYMSGRG